MASYHGLLSNGWRMNDIDDMDFLGWMRVMAYGARKEDGIKPGHIDDLAFFACGTR